MPTDVMNRPAWEFWMNARIRAAGVAWENETEAQAQRQSSTGAASETEKRDMVRDQEARADRREAADGSAPSMGDQMAALEGGS